METTPRARILMSVKEADVSNFVRQPSRYSEYISKADRNGKIRLSVRFCALDQAAELLNPRKYDKFPDKALQFQFLWRIIELETRERQGIGRFQHPTPL